MDTLAEKLAYLVPTSLDDIIKVNRDRLQLYLSTTEELEALRCETPSKPVKATISAWSFITLNYSEVKKKAIVLAGFNQDQHCTWMTSAVTGIDGNRVTTYSGSLYEFVGDSTTDVDLLHVCAMLHRWGIGPLFGVTHIFY
jgi:hypothetical protein